MNSFGYLYSCMLSFILFPLVLPSAVVLRKATEHFMAPGGAGQRLYRGRVILVFSFGHWRHFWLCCSVGLSKDVTVPGLKDELPLSQAKFGKYASRTSMMTTLMITIICSSCKRSSSSKKAKTFSPAVSHFSLLFM